MRAKRCPLRLAVPPFNPRGFTSNEKKRKKEGRSRAEAGGKKEREGKGKIFSSGKYLNNHCPGWHVCCTMNSSNYEKRDTRSALSGALIVPRLPGARHPQAALPHATQHAHRRLGKYQSARQPALIISRQVSSPHDFRRQDHRRTVSRPHSLGLFWRGRASLSRPTDFRNSLGALIGISEPGLENESPVCHQTRAVTLRRGREWSGREPSDIDEAPKGGVRWSERINRTGLGK